MAVRQVRTPNINVPAYRGYCLKYLDDGISAPDRQPTATSAYNVELNNGNVRTNDLPIGVWIPIFFDLTTGPYKGLGHIAWALNHGNGWVEIHDSETQAGARAVYRSIAEVLAWFGKQGIVYKGWGLWLDGVQIAEEYTVPNPGEGGALPNQGFKKRTGTATVTVDLLNIRNDPSDDNSIVGSYSKGQTFNYDGFLINDGYVWLSYVSYSGVRRYVAEGPNDGKSDTVWVSGGVA